jgi:formylglycine-generating enzyme required for sulfatase activity
VIGIALSLSLLSTPAPTALPVQENPPGFVLVKGGKTKIGTKVKEAEPLIIAFEPLANTIAGQTPQITVDVDDFLIMVTEVTNEQYAKFVEVTGAQPPYYWGAEALEAGRVAFLEADAKKRQEALAIGERPVRGTWDPSAWWDENWKGSDWTVPTDKLDSPVVYISYNDAEDYAQWAGMRLMTEFEYTRAARGDGDADFPWGKDWDPAACNSLEYKENDEPTPAGHFPEGAPNGIFDLCGNVWEWTSSPFRKFEGYKALRVKTGRGKQARTIEPLAPFDPTARVAVSGSFAQTMVGVRIPTRQPTAKYQRTEALGFRCAANPTSGVDTAVWLQEKTIDKTLALISQHNFFSPGTIVLQRWQSSPGTSAVANYAVVSDYEASLFCPVFDLGASSKNELTKNSSEGGPQVLGLLSLAQPMMVPELDGGTYIVAWRGAGKLKELDQQDDSKDADANLQLGGGQDGTRPFWEVPGFDPEVECVLLYSVTGEPIAVFPAAPMTFKRMKGKGSVRLDKFVPPEEEPEEDAPPIIPMDTLTFSLLIGGKRSMGASIDLPIKISPGTIDDSWWRAQ